MGAGKKGTGNASAWKTADWSVCTDAERQSEYQIKKSRFIASAFSMTEQRQLTEALKTVNEAYPDARHHCWACITGAGPGPEQESRRWSDDGEPSGTAGKPILNVLQHRQITEVLIVVSRYFGGIKLGAGGLVRAYGTSAGQLLDQLPVKRLMETVRLQLAFDFSREQQVRHYLEKFNAQILSLEYGQGVNCDVVVAEENMAEMEEAFQAKQLARFIK